MKQSTGHAAPVKPYAKIERYTYRLSRYYAEDGGGVLGITAVRADGRRETSVYWLREVPSDAGRSFRLTRYTDDGAEVAAAYRVALAGNGCQSCECASFRHQHSQDCKHCGCIRDAIDSRRLPGPAGYPEGEPDVPDGETAADAY